MIAYKIETTDLATPALRRLALGLAPARVNPLVGRAVRNASVEHFRELNSSRPNHLGGARTNYYLGAARGTNFTADEAGATISIAQVGIRQRYYGGRITAGKSISRLTGRPTRFLTIPVHPLAHGHRASEFELELVYNHNGAPVALATKSTLGVQIKQTKNGKITKVATGRRGEIMYLLRRSIMQQADPSVLPAPDRLYGAAISRLNSHLERLLQRAAPPPSE
jgi:hypothetical protein